MALCGSTDHSNTETCEWSTLRDEVKGPSSSSKLNNNKSIMLDYRSISPQNDAVNEVGSLDKRAWFGVKSTACVERPIELCDLNRDPDTQTVDSLKETQHDPFQRSLCRRLFCDDGVERIVTAHIIFAMGVTIGLVMHIYVAPPAMVGPAVVVSDSELCASLGRDVLKEGGSSVDAAITTALCQGIVHPHISGIGGGGVMLIYNGRRNKSYVIDFGETAPSKLHADMLQRNEHSKPGLLVGVPGMLRGLDCAHQLYGRKSWDDLVMRVAKLAKEGVNMSHSLAQAIDIYMQQNTSESVRKIFLPLGDSLHVNSRLRLSRLASVLEQVARNGAKDFYTGKISEEIVSTVKANGGVLTSDDLANYRPIQQAPLIGLYKGYQVMVPPPPNAGVALLSFLNIMQGFTITAQEKTSSHWIAESLKAALAMVNGIADPNMVSSMPSTILHMQSKTHATILSQLISKSDGILLPSHYTALHSLQGGATVSSQVIVMGSDDLIVSLSCSLNRAFGSEIMTPSGILLNSATLSFSRLSDSQNMTWLNERNRIQGGKSPRSFLMPTIVRQRGRPCGRSIALGASAGSQALSGIAQVLINLLSVHKNLTDSISDGRLHPRLQTNIILIDGAFQESQAKALRQGGHVVERVDELGQVVGAERKGNTICGVTDPRSSEASAKVLLGGTH